MSGDRVQCRHTEAPRVQEEGDFLEPWEGPAPGYQWPGARAASSFRKLLPLGRLALPRR